MYGLLIAKLTVFHVRSHTTLSIYSSVYVCLRECIYGEEKINGDWVAPYALFSRSYMCINVCVCVCSAIDLNFLLFYLNFLSIKCMNVKRKWNWLKIYTNKQTNTVGCIQCKWFATFLTTLRFLLALSAWFGRPISDNFVCVCVCADFFYTFLFPCHFFHLSLEFPRQFSFFIDFLDKSFICTNTSVQIQMLRSGNGSGKFSISS